MRHCSCSASRAASGTSWAAGSPIASTSRIAPTSTRSRPPLAERAQSFGALGASISGAGPTVLVWTHYEQTGAVVDALRREAEGWAEVVRAPFESVGARVRSLT